MHHPPLEAALAQYQEAVKRVVDKCSRPGMKDPFDDQWQWYYRCQEVLTAVLSTWEE